MVECDFSFFLLLLLSLLLLFWRPAAQHHVFALAFCLLNPVFIWRHVKPSERGEKDESDQLFHASGNSRNHFIFLSLHPSNTGSYAGHCHARVKTLEENDSVGHCFSSERALALLSVVVFGLFLPFTRWNRLNLKHCHILCRLDHKSVGLIYGQ